MTPYELRMCIEAANDRLIDDRGRDLWISWHTAYLGRVDRFPHLNELMPKVLQHRDGEKPEHKKADGPDPNMSVNLMNALLKFKTAPPPPKDPDLKAEAAQNG